MVKRLKEYFFEVDLSNDSEKSGWLTSLSIPGIRVASSIDHLDGNKQKWTAEHMIAGSVSVSYMNTFLTLAESQNLRIQTYRSHCFIKLENKDGDLLPSEILIRPTIILKGLEDLSKVVQLIEKAESKCPIINVLKMTIKIHPHVDYMGRVEKIIV